MAITQVEIIGIREAEQYDLVTSKTVNFTYYSLLIFYDDQKPQLIEGDASRVAQYLQYVKPQNDPDFLETLLKSHEAKIKEIVSGEVLKG